MHGHHLLYKEAWRPAIGQIRTSRLSRKLDNRHDRRAAAVFGDVGIVGHVPESGQGLSEDNMHLFMRFLSLWTTASKCLLYKHAANIAVHLLFQVYDSLHTVSVAERVNSLYLKCLWVE